MNPFCTFAKSTHYDPGSTVSLTPNFLVGWKAGWLLHSTLSRVLPSPEIGKFNKNVSCALWHNLNWQRRRDRRHPDMRQFHAVILERQHHHRSTIINRNAPGLFIDFQNFNQSFSLTLGQNNGIFLGRPDRPYRQRHSHERAFLSQDCRDANQCDFRQWWRGFFPTLFWLWDLQPEHVAVRNLLIWVLRRICRVSVCRMANGKPKKINHKRVSAHHAFTNTGKSPKLRSPAIRNRAPKKSSHAPQLPLYA